MAKPSTAKPITRRSTSLRAFQAASTPIGMARHDRDEQRRQRQRQRSARGAGRSAASPAGWRRSRRRGRPAAGPRARRANCSTTGRSRPSLARTAAIASAVASSPAMIAAGSPGAKRSRKNTNTATTDHHRDRREQPAHDVGGHIVSSHLRAEPAAGARLAAAAHFLRDVPAAPTSPVLGTMPSMRSAR